MVRPSDTLKGAAGPAPSACSKRGFAPEAFFVGTRGKSTQNALLQESFESIR